MLDPIARLPEIVVGEREVRVVDGGNPIEVGLEPAVGPERRQPLLAHGGRGRVVVILERCVAAAEVDHRSRAVRVDGVRRDVARIHDAAVVVRHGGRIVWRVVALIEVRLQLRVAREELPLVVQVPIGAVVEVPVLEQPRVVGAEIVDARDVVARAVRTPDILHEQRRRGVDARWRNHVARKRLARARVVRGVETRGPGIVNRAQSVELVQRLRKVSRALEIGRHGASRVARLACPPHLVARKREELVLANRTADRAAADMIPDQVRHARPRRRVGDGVERRVPAEIVRRAVDVVRAGLDRQAQHAARRMSELGVDGILLYRELLHRVHRRRVAALLIQLQRRSIEEQIVLAIRRSAHVDRTRRPHEERIPLGAVAVHHRRIEQCQRERIPLFHRKLAQHLPVDRQLSGRRVELELRRRIGHRDRIGHLPRVQRQIHGHVRASLHEHARSLRAGESGELGADRVGAGLDEVEQVVAGRASRARDLDAGVLIPQYDLRVRQRRLRGVGDHSLDLGAIILRE